MGPKLDDQFVYTISDDDADLPGLEDDEVELKETTILRKRKRDEPKASTTVNGKQPKNKKRKKGHKVKEGQAEEELQSASGEDSTWAAEGEDDGAFASDFEFQVGDGDVGDLEDFDGWGVGKSAQVDSTAGSKGVDLDEIIARRRQNTDAKVGAKGRSVTGEDSDSGGGDFQGFEDEDDELLAEDGFGMGAQDEGDDEESGSDSDDESVDINGADSGAEQDSDDDSVAPPVAHPLDEASEDDASEDEAEDPAEAKRRADFFAPEENLDGHKPPNGMASGSFQSMSLSRPILKGLAAVGFSEPTPIQAKTIPVALLGKDVVGGAVTGSGKTAAFMLPILERLLYRPKKVPTTRVAILMPTRELAVQCFNVAKKLAAFTDITFAQIVGGYSLREQEQVLRKRPDVVIATPGRFIDHMRNSASFAIDTLEILVLDEADRMLEDGFADELNEILTTIPKSRQTMLFSATMTDSVDKLIRIGLNRPVRLLVNTKSETVSGLVQEFVRLRPGKEDKKLAYLLYLCEKVYMSRTIIFLRQKKEAHRIRIIFGLCGLKSGELHGSMSQEQRISAIESFRLGTTNFLLATDLASRGLDIKTIDAVINYGAPQSHETYVHRIGRTARAGRSGRACTIAGEEDRKVIRSAVKAARAQGAKVVSRMIPTDEIERWSEKVAEAEEEVEDVVKEEKEMKALDVAERQIAKGGNLIKYADEIASRPKRTWFQSEKEKLVAKEKGAIELNGEIAVKGKKKKLSNKEKKKLDLKDERAQVGGGWKKGKAERGIDAKKLKEAAKAKGGENGKKVKGKR